MRKTWWVKKLKGTECAPGSTIPWADQGFQFALMYKGETVSVHPTHFAADKAYKRKVQGGPSEHWEKPADPKVLVGVKDDDFYFSVREEVED